MQQPQKPFVPRLALGSLLGRGTAPGPVSAAEPMQAEREHARASMRSRSARDARVCGAARRDGTAWHASRLALASYQTGCMMPIFSCTVSGHIRTSAQQVAPPVDSPGDSGGRKRIRAPEGQPQTARGVNIICYTIK